MYPFGYGLSYTSFEYGNLQINKQAKAGDSVRISVAVKNTGSMAGDEVAQVYVSAKNPKVRVPLRSLSGFKRIHLNPGETKTLDFVLPPFAFSAINENNQRVTMPGNYQVSVGGGQPGVKRTTSNILSTDISLL